MTIDVQSKAKLLHKLSSSDARVAVIGLGYVGLPLTVSLADAGYRVTGIDVDPQRVHAVNEGDPGTPDVPAQHLQRLLSEGAIAATTTFEAIEECDAVSICVPTPLRKTGDPDISYIVEATESLAPHLRSGTVVVLESTTYPGTTSEMVLPRLVGGQEDLVVGENLFLAFSPERVDPGREDWDVRTTPKVIGGITPDCLEAASAYYGRAIDTIVPVSSAETAEMVKLLENTFRAVNIGLANEVLLMCDRLDLDAWEVIDAASSKPFGYMRFTPGPGLGGHCIPIDPLYLSWKLRSLDFTARFIDLASEINGNMPRYWAARVQDILNDSGKPLRGSRVLVLGVAYKKDVSDVRESPALDIIRLLQMKGGIVNYHDPHVPRLDQDGLTMECVNDLERALASSDCIVVVTDHSAYDLEMVRQARPPIVDTRHALGSATGRNHAVRREGA